MTREQVLAHIAGTLAKVANECNVAMMDDPSAFQYVISETLNWAKGDEKKMPGLANYFAYRLFYAKLVTNGLPVSSEILTAMRGTEAWCVNAGFDFSGKDE